MLPDKYHLDDGTMERMPFELLKKYLIYSKRHFKPKLGKIDQDKVTNFYADIRRESNVVGGIPIAVRHIESLIRMSEAHAKLHLRDEVTHKDIDVAIELLLDSFIQSQKHSVARQLWKKFEKYKQRQNDTSYLLLHILQKVVNTRVSIILIISHLNIFVSFRHNTKEWSKESKRKTRSLSKCQCNSLRQRPLILIGAISCNSTRMRSSRNITRLKETTL